MHGLRRLLLKQPLLAALVLASALLLRMAVPAGYMPVWQGGTVSLALCPDAGPLPAARPMHHGAAAAVHHGHDDRATLQQRCAFADLSLPALGGADPVQLAAALAFLLVLALLCRAALPRLSTPRLRPPLRAPPFPA